MQALCIPLRATAQVALVLLLGLGNATISHAALIAYEKFDQELFRSNTAKVLHQLNPDDEKPEVPDLVKLYNAFVVAHDTLSAATPPRPNEKRKTFQKIPTL